MELDFGRWSSSFMSAFIKRPLFGLTTAFQFLSLSLSLFSFFVFISLHIRLFLSLSFSLFCRCSILHLCSSLMCFIHYGLALFFLQSILSNVHSCVFVVFIALSIFLQSLLSTSDSFLMPTIFYSRHINSVLHSFLYHASPTISVCLSVRLTGSGNLLRAL